MKQLTLESQSRVLVWIASARAWSWRELLTRGKAHTIADVAAHTGLTERYVREVMPLAFLAPDIVTAILAGRQPRHLTLAGLHAAARPLTWATQRDRLHLA